MGASLHPDACGYDPASLALNLSETGRRSNTCLVTHNERHLPEGGTPSTDGHRNAVPAHPLNIKPCGNAYAAKYNIKLATGAFASLPDELLITILELLDPDSIVSVGNTCKALHAFSRFEDLWKSFCVR